MMDFKLLFLEIFLALFSLILLLINIFFIKNQSVRYFSWLFLLIISFLILLISSPDVSKNDTFLFLSSSLFLFRVIIFLFGIFLFLSYYPFLISERYLNEFSFFFFSALAFLSLLFQTQNLLIAFVLIECLSFLFYLLVSFYKRDLYSVEAGLKYFYLGTFSSLIFFLGLFFVYYSSLELNLTEILSRSFLTSKAIFFNLGLLLIFSSLVFKLGGAPFHFWMPEVYQGSPLPVFPLLISLSKLSFLIFLANLLFLIHTQSTPSLSFESLQNFFLIVSFLSMIIGNLLALKQKEVKRLLAYSSISHIGYLLALFSVPFDKESLRILYAYIFIYTLTNVGIYIALILISNPREIKIPLSIYEEGLKNKALPLLFSLLIFSFTLAGLPPSAGFITKLFLLLELVKKKAYLLSITLLLTSILSLYYYFRLIGPVLRALRAYELSLVFLRLSLYEILMLSILTIFSLYLFLSTFKIDFIFFFT